MNTMQTEAQTDILRNEDLDRLVHMLRTQHVRKVDVVAPATALTAVDGNIVLSGAEPILAEDGVLDANGTYTPNRVAVEGIAGKLGIPLAYMRRMHLERPDLFDANVNGWLHGAHPRMTPGFQNVNLGPEFDGHVQRQGYPADERSFLVRAFTGDDGGPGIMRAFLSDRYGVMDNLDALMAVLSGIQQAGVEVRIDGADLSDRRMYVRVVSDQVRALAPTLLRDYRSPFSGNRGADNPVIFAGFVVSNSEVGDGAFSIAPRMVIEVCNNGLTVAKDAMRAVHLGSRMEHGTINWSDDTREKNVALITAKARDAVSQFLTPGYLQAQVDRIEERAEKPVEEVEQVRAVAKSLAFTVEQQDKVLQHFSKGGSWTAGGVMNAVTSAAQEFGADDAADMEARALQAMLAV